MTKFARTPRIDGDVTRAKILEQAGKLFAELGYGGTSSKAICEAVGANLAAINYHFGSREGLYHQVLLEGYKHFVSLDALASLAHSDLPPREKLAAFIDQMVRSVKDDTSWHNQVCSRELLSPTMHHASMVSDEVMPKFKLVGAIVSDITGIPPGNPALARCVVSVMAPCLVLLVVDRKSASPAQQLLSHAEQDLAAHLKRFALAGLDAISADEKAKTVSNLTT